MDEHARADDDPLLSIGVFARRSRLSMKALRLYDRRGLLTPAYVDRRNGYRRYRESQLATARLIVLLRRLDMPLAQVAQVVSAPGTTGAELIASYWHAVEQRVAGQRELAAHLRTRLLGEDARVQGSDVRQRDMPEQLVLTEQRHVLIDDLMGWRDAAVTRLIASAREYGGAVGDHFVIFHGEVNEDSDGPVEVCVPIDPAQEVAPSNRAVRREPAHREAYVELTKARFEFPQILSAYDTVAQWIHDRGFAMAASPREICFTDVRAAAPTDKVCDVAFPIR